MDAIEFIAAHVINRNFEDLPENAVVATRTFILDSLGVGIVGSSGPWVEELINVQSSWGAADDARVWVRGLKLPAPAVAMCNAYQLHNSEFDCVHEEAVVHALTVVLPSVLAVAERNGLVDGKRLIEAVALGVDVACNLGMAANSGLRFFRPGTAGAFAAVAGLGKILGFEQNMLVNAFSIVYAQLCGTMQAHTEGSMLLGMQVGFNARNAVTACDMAASGLQGPKGVLEGEFGYFNLIEQDAEFKPIQEQIGKIWRITEMAHKPFPSGRATHGLVDGCLRLRKAHKISWEEIKVIKANVPPLVHHLVGRPPLESMGVNYARLCACYVLSRALINGIVTIEDFRIHALSDEATLNLSNRVSLRVDDNPDENALAPIDLEILLYDGTRHLITIENVYGGPKNPLSYGDHIQKFKRNCLSAAIPLSDDKIATLIETVEDLENCSDVSALVDCMVA